MSASRVARGQNKLDAWKLLHLMPPSVARTECERITEGIRIRSLAEDRKWSRVDTEFLAVWTLALVFGGLLWGWRAAFIKALPIVIGVSAFLYPLRSGYLDYTRCLRSGGKGGE